MCPAYISLQGWHTAPTRTALGRDNGQAYALLAAGLEIDSENAQLKEGLADAKLGKDRPQNTGGGGAGGLFGPDFMAKLVRVIRL